MVNILSLLHFNPRTCVRCDLVCNALAASYVQNPVSITSGAVVNVDIVTNAIIGQLRGRYAKELEDQDGQNTKSQSSDSEN